MTQLNAAIEPQELETAAAAIASQMDALLRGEISAAETYRLAIDKVAQGDGETARLLRDIQEEHGRAAQSLRDRIRELGGEASNSSGAWGFWAKTVQSAANLFGGASAIKSLREGEERGLREYEQASQAADPTTQQFIQNQLIPAQRRHMAVLDQLIKSENK